MPEHEPEHAPAPPSLKDAEWLKRPQNGETMVTYDLTRDEVDAAGNPTQAINE